MPAVWVDAGQVFDKPAPPVDEVAGAKAEEPKKESDKPSQADTNPILHRIQEAILQVIIVEAMFQ